MKLDEKVLRGLKIASQWETIVDDEMSLEELGQVDAARGWLYEQLPTVGLCGYCPGEGGSHKMSCDRPAFPVPSFAAFTAAEWDAIQGDTTAEKLESLLKKGKP